MTDPIDSPVASPAATPTTAAPEPVPPSVPDEIEIQAHRKITLRCGKSSITLYPNGKIVLHGEYILSDAEGVNRIAGGQIELN